MKKVYVVFGNDGSDYIVKIFGSKSRAKEYADLLQLHADNIKLNVDSDGHFKGEYDIMKINEQHMDKRFDVSKVNYYRVEGTVCH